MAKKKLDRCPNTQDIEDLIAAHKMREEQEAFDHAQFEKEWLEQLELYSKREPRTFELHLVSPDSNWRSFLKGAGEGALWSMAIVGVLTVGRMIYHVLMSINA